MTFLGDVVVRQVDAKRWELIEPLTYRGNRESFTVERGFITDFASVPRLFVWLLPSYGDYTKAAILHDYLCKKKPVDRADADGLFRRAMRELEVSFARRWMMWAAVRAASFLRGATPRQTLEFAVVAPPSLLYVAAPAAAVQLFLVLFWLIELLIWLVGRLFGKHAPRPDLAVRAA